MIGWTCGLVFSPASGRLFSALFLNTQLIVSEDSNATIENGVVHSALISYGLFIL